MKKILLTLTLISSSFLISCQTTSLTQVGNSTYRFYSGRLFQYNTEVEKCDVAADGKKVTCKDVTISYE
ncbi:hypothetical protein ND861_13060 [Leptospira sp. 2 VSF19]|uniref:Lipoprotein n=1 Tax=Leptospira soteropolitanensis TaxID=2950025 RepID=A0AAW5VHU3_9LEPT|nr:hypothetical protein [Leptospira soteropolitanensis]MCW7493572.1 hypothetical protein [Leptospira soteropolitanensis]MCW7501171.1 hypothetical protein [Leptospira soteropolitanensis]MCW7523643.1 hypothetical protein [Leptospira soteropolitanensis]MCW7527284.1 hypothetical protein [Leptospira soteropolitanensis]MCW7531141.1 hypothetical protein [Leptospira soteropolitanensis]